MADIRIQDLPVAPEAHDADIFPASQDKDGGVLETRKVTLAQVRALIQQAFDSRYARLAEAAHFLDDLDVDGAVALADTLRVAKKATLEGDLDVDGAVALLQMLTVGGDPLIKAKDAAKLSGGDDADFATMPKVGGDYIVESGSNANGSWTKWADGTMMCWQQFNYPSDTYNATGFVSSSKSWTFPQNFTSAPAVSGSSKPHGEVGFFSSYSSQTDLTAFYLCSLKPSITVLTDVRIQALGRWK